MGESKRRKALGLPPRPSWPAKKALSRLQRKALRHGRAGGAPLGRHNADRASSGRPAVVCERRTLPRFERAEATALALAERDTKRMGRRAAVKRLRWLAAHPTADAGARAAHAVPIRKADA
jgi:hypothetical protein